MKKPSKTVLTFISGVGSTLMLILLVKAVLYFFFPSPEQALPFFAKGIETKTYVNGFLPDYSYELKADINEVEFQGFLKRIGLHKHYNPEKNIYREENTRYHWFREAYYRDGYLYYKEMKT